MRYLLDEALEQGAWGYSTGLEYAAERGADEDELVAMCEVCGRRHGLYATHTRRRDDGRRRGASRRRSARATARACGCRSRTSCRATGSSRRAAASSSSTRRSRRGMDVAFDMHTRLYGTTFLLTALPPWALEDHARLREILASANGDARCGDYGASSAPAATGAGSSCSTTTSGPSTRAATSPSIAAERGQEPLDAVYDLLLGAADDPAQADGDHPRLHRGGAARGVRPSALRAGLRRDDARAGRPARRARSSTAPTPGPRGSPLLVREEQLLSLAEARAPADRRSRRRGSGCPTAGVLRTGAHAPISRSSIPAAFSEDGTTFDPSRLATGMDTVVVNGM